MIRFYHKKGLPFENLAVIFVLFICSALCICDVGAQEKQTGWTNGKVGSTEKISVASEKLLIDQKENTAEFTGKVKAVQGSTTIVCERLIIFYRGKSSEPPKEGNSGENSLEKVIAEGNVEIKFDNGLAVTSHAVYNTNEKVLVLSGDGTKLTRGKDTISGSKIIFNRQTNQLQVEGRVKANIFSEEKVLN